MPGPVQAQSLVGRWEDRAVVTGEDSVPPESAASAPFSKGTQSQASRSHQGLPGHRWAAAICELWHGDRQAAKQTWDNLYC